jgi:hypothetical protein
LGPVWLASYNRSEVVAVPSHAAPEVPERADGLAATVGVAALFLLASVLGA